VMSAESRADVAMSLCDVRTGHMPVVTTHK
jgi:hypothetical protein